MKLNVAAGKRLLEGFTNHDILDLPGIGIKCEMMDLPKHVKNNSCEEIAAYHIIEHFPTNDVQKVLKMLFDLLKQGGKISIETPNFRYHAQLCLNGDVEKAIHLAFGGQLDDWDFHKTGFTSTILATELIQVGFKNISIQQDATLIAEAYK